MAVAKLLEEFQDNELTAFWMTVAGIVVAACLAVAM